MYLYNTDISLIGGQDEKTSTPITVSTQGKYISISQDGGKEITEFIITSTNGVFLRESYTRINFLGNYKEASRICAIEKGTKIHILQLKRIPNNELWYKIHITDRGEEYKEKKTIKNETIKTETTTDMSTMSPEENCPSIIKTGWIIGKYGDDKNDRKTININVDEKQLNNVDEKQTNWEQFQSCLFRIKFYRWFPIGLGIIGGFKLYCFAKSGDNSSLFWEYLRTKGVLLFFISLSAIIFTDSYSKQLDRYSRYVRHYDPNLSWGFLGKFVQDLLATFFNINDFWGNVAAGLILTLLFLKFFPMNKD